MKEIYKKLIREYLEKGGSQSFIDKQSPVYSLQNEAKLRFELRKLNAKHNNSIDKSKIDTSKTEVVTSNKKVATSLENLNDVGFISEYPVDLHSVYLERKQKFIAACSLKMRLNEVPDDDNETAYHIQLQIMKCFDFIDKANEVLNHYRKFKRILPLKNEVDFSKLTRAEMIQQRNRLRSNISNRQNTIKKLEQQVAKASSKDKVRLNSKLTQKIEQLNELKLQVDELNKLIE